MAFSAEVILSLFWWTQSAISECINWALDFIDGRWSLLLQDFDSGLLPESILSTFASVIHKKGAPLDSCWGFLDCTIRPICRPTIYQRQAYNGHKKQHALKGWRNDNHLLDSSGLLDRCERNTDKSTSDGSYYLYGDRAYPSSRYLLSPFAKGDNISPAEYTFNTQMSQVFLSAIGLEYRVAVILTNAHVCLYGSQVSSYFECEPPSLENYLN
ncbi:hypothetical protein P167DRAFT_561165 [Morchella conica CCBAS932]|uniref:DDE Tnp4 domain-containing protein n=1 Tax=Morchella conica CCBAS932 TaxID=1392247 RepID=A0A3N4K7M6_9PEZI|nr:hypothetical protein P167DRAFT_561165 [Morchella conica CCBAS932]